MQTGNDAKVDLEKLYEMVLRNSWHILRPGGRVVMLVLRGLQLLQILRRLSFRFKILDMRIVKTGNNLPSLFVLERIESDPEYDSLKEQLCQPEMNETLLTFGRRCLWIPTCAIMGNWLQVN